MKTAKTLLLLLAVTLSFTACNKDDDSDNDLTTTIVGYYEDGSTAINVTKVDDTHVSIAINVGSLVFTNATMNTATSFTLNTLTLNNVNCVGTEVITGSGTCTSSSIAITVLIDATNPPGLNACMDQTLLFNGTRQ